MFGEGWVLYCLCHPDMHVDASDKNEMTFYVGISKNLETRIMRHLVAADSDQNRPITQWIRSLSSEPILVPIAGGYKTFEEARTAEDNAIEKLRALGSPLLNGLTPRERAAQKEMDA